MREKGEEEGEEDKVQGEREEGGDGSRKKERSGRREEGGDNGNIWNIGEGNGIRNGGTLQ